MFKSSISNKFFSDDPSFAADVTSTIEQFSTPLKKLPNSSINDFRNDILNPNPEEPTRYKTDSPLSRLSSKSSKSASSNTELQRSQLYKLISDSTSIDKTSFPSSGVHRMELPVHLNEKQTSGKVSNLFNKEVVSKANGAVFYKPTSFEGPILSKSFIPPPLQQSGRNPIIVSQESEQEYVNADFEDLSDDNDEIQTSPTGEWTSPVVIEALRRQVNKERIFKGVRRDILRFFGFYLVLLFAAYFYKLYQLKFYNENRLYRNDAWSQFERLKFAQTSFGILQQCNVYIYHVQWIFILQVVFGIVQLLKPQDQCADLPLTNRQRELIGLKQVNFGEDEEESKADLVIKERLFESAVHQPIKVPKYQQLNEFQKHDHRYVGQQQHDDAAIALANVLPTPRLIHSGHGVNI